MDVKNRIKWNWIPHFNASFMLHQISIDDNMAIERVQNYSFQWIKKNCKINGRSKKFTSVVENILKLHSNYQVWGRNCQGDIP